MLARPRSSAACGFRVAARPVPVVTRRSRAMVKPQALKVGDSLRDSPEFYRVLKASDGSIQSLAMFVNEHKQPVVLFFYPAAGTPGCTKEACKFRDEYARFQDAGAVVFGISGDAPEKNAEWAKQQRLPFLLLTDPSGIMRKTFGIPNDLLFLPGRQTYVFDPNGKCVLAFNSQLDAEKHVDEALAALRQLGALKK
ncbi:thioredoxin dependent peroxidase [Raphidocelis subcapitata]|uniref:thioredoxin-dependent peroxiredoxin n=1 Tax=Raphidocelis subcapitata TaxID=307507 RepID=A0A2V0P9S6_9CHLO|nr:thioredoxin dependent peroxidase [Raphidocelis subcapitata]|eukprot:GBF96596.1 thioredoxin dependent peroxidase [Raphidocelis subcapitata]